MKEILERKILPKVAKPARYTGGELNSIKKDWEKKPIRIALAYPDTYEIGMSNLGIAILYKIFNDEKDTLAERVFCPWPDMEAKMKEFKVPLFSIESKKPVKDFDMIGFSFGHELTYTNFLNMLKLAEIPFKTSERDKEFPLIFAGGPALFNPEPIADFIDFMVIGEAEDVLLEILDVYRKNKERSKKEILFALSQLKGVYVPSLYEVKYNNDGTMSSITPKEAGIPAIIDKRIVKDLNKTPYPTKCIVPNTEVVHDRAMIEIMRGCPRNCRFCQAGYTCKPVRTRKPEVIMQLADETIKNTGFEDLSLVSLSTSDYPKIESVARDLAAKFKSKMISISLPSTRVDSFSQKLAREIAKVRPTGITLAPEAGTERLRKAIGKEISEDAILDAAKTAFEEGCNSVKLYFMIGLPTETDEDLKAIAELGKKILGIGHEAAGRKGMSKKRIRVTISLATFVPKPHTPFQWEEQIKTEQTLRRQKLIKSITKVRGLELRWHQAELSYLEGIFARGDRHLAALIEKAWSLGAKFDAWTEHFNFEIWQKAFKEAGIDPDFYLRKRSFNEALPWEHISAGIIKERLIEENNAAHLQN